MMQIDISEETTPPLTDWKNEPDVDTLKEDLKKADPSHKEWVSKIENWRALLDVEGSQKPPKIKGRSSVQPRVVRRQAEWRYSALTEPFLSSDRIFKVYPRTFEDGPAAKQNELLLNYQFDTKLNKVKFIDELVRTVVDEGTGIVRLGWDRQTTTETVQVPVYAYYPIQDQMQLQQFQQALQMAEADPRSFNEQAPEELKAAIDYFKETQQPCLAVFTGEYQEVEEEVILENKPALEILNPNNVYIDPSCNGNLDKALFVILSFETNRAELLQRGVYKNLDHVNWDGMSTALNDGDHTSTTPDDFNFSDTFRRKVVAYEYWGFYDVFGNDTLTPIVATWIGNTMIRMELNPYPDGKLPFVIIPYLPVKRSIYGEPDASLLEDTQRIIGALTRGMIDLLGSSANAQQGFAKGMLDPINKQRFLEGKAYEFNPNIPPQQGYIQHTYPEISNSAVNLLTIMNQDAESLTGVKAFTGGISGDSYGQVVAGIKGAIDASGKREMAILRRLAKGMSEIGSKIIAMNAAFLSEEEVVRVTNRQFIAIRKEDIQGNFDLIVDINTAEVDNLKAQDLGFLLQTMGPNMDPSISFEIIAQIAELKRMPDLAEKIRNYRPQPSPQAEAEVAKTQSEAELNKAKAQEAMAKAQTEGVNAQVEMANAQAKIMDVQSKSQESAYKAQDARNKAMESLAKARALNADTDMKLSGEDFYRDLEKQKAQARANQDLEVTKALLQPRKREDVKPDVSAAIGYNLLSRNM